MDDDDMAGMSDKARPNIEVERNTGGFRVRSGALLLVRLGPANGQVQRHRAFPRDMVTGEKNHEERLLKQLESRLHGGDLPFHRGYWAFPYPMHDAFFYYHVWKRHMPKEFRNGINWTELSEDEQEVFQERMDKAMEAVRKRVRLKFIWCPRPFYSLVPPSHFLGSPLGGEGNKKWHLYTNAREWVEAARRDLWCWNRMDDEPPWKARYSKDHLQIFVPC